MSYLVLTLGDFVLGDIIIGDFVQKCFCPRGYVLRGFVMGDSVPNPMRITCIDEWKDPTFSTPVTKSPLTISENASLSSPHIEAMMYATVKEIYRRTCT